MPVRPPRVLTRATVSAALLAAVSFACPSASAAESPGHRAEVRTAAERSPAANGADRPADRTDRPAARAADRTGRPPHLADTGAAAVTRIGAVALVFMAAGVLLLAAARRLRRR
ncbi:hypothetical protein DMH18_29600 [Streptomyces sp. WAC 06783]|uniref:hypothetical protein n=1 Tax=Streptomyces sp. WAC 06783 TaxID=2203211 RepID=UPI000F73E060|nr:hypothetical protein [Streptomyces sp. WAC 06783]RSO05841.1 hypothetical protein DMH18_29600 [Streptomyces sp. WAC 06783]